MVIACITGGVLGISFIIPLRKQMIDFNRLAYPGGIAVATILKSPGAGMQKAMLLHRRRRLLRRLRPRPLIMIMGAGHPPGTSATSSDCPSYLNIAFYLSLLTVGVGFLSGKGGLVFGLGGFICYFFLAPAPRRIR